MKLDESKVKLGKILEINRISSSVKQNHILRTFSNLVQVYEY